MVSIKQKKRSYSTLAFTFTFFLAFTFFGFLPTSAELRYQNRCLKKGEKGGRKKEVLLHDPLFVLRFVEPLTKVIVDSESNCDPEQRAKMPPFLRTRQIPFLTAFLPLISRVFETTF